MADEQPQVRKERKESVAPPVPPPPPVAPPAAPRVSDASESGPGIGEVLAAANSSITRSLSNALMEEPSGDNTWEARDISTPVSTSASASSPRVGAAGAVNPSMLERKARARAALGPRLKRTVERMTAEANANGGNNGGTVSDWSQLVANPEIAPHPKFAEVFAMLTNYELKWYTNLLIPGMVVDAASARLVIDTLGDCTTPWGGKSELERGGGGNRSGSGPGGKGRPGNSSRHSSSSSSSSSNSSNSSGLSPGGCGGDGDAGDGDQGDENDGESNDDTAARRECPRCQEGANCVDLAVWLYWSFHVEARRILEVYDPSAEDDQASDKSTQASSSSSSKARVAQQSSAAAAASRKSAAKIKQRQSIRAGSLLVAALTTNDSEGGGVTRERTASASSDTSAASSTAGAGATLGEPIPPPPGIRYSSLLASLTRIKSGPFGPVVQKHLTFVATMRGLQARLAELPKNARAKSDKRVRFAKLLRVCADFNDLSLPMPSPLHPSSVTLESIIVEKSVMLKSADNSLRGVILVLAFETSPKRSPHDPPYTVVFKAGDDLRRDQMVLSMMEMMQSQVADAAGVKMGRSGSSSSLVPSASESASSSSSSSSSSNLNSNSSSSSGLSSTSSSTSSSAGRVQISPGDMRLTIYAVLATDVSAGLMEFIPNSRTLQDVFETGLEKYLRAEGKPRGCSDPKDSFAEEELYRTARQNMIVSTAGYAVVGYILGFGDRHLENIMQVSSPWNPETHGRICHIDFNRLLGDEPKGKGKQPPMRLPSQLMNFIGESDFVHFVFAAVKFYTLLRPLHPAIRSLFLSMVDAGALPSDAKTLSAIEATVTEKLRPELVGEQGKAEAANHIYSIILKSSDRWKQALIDAIHRMKNP